MTDMPDFSEAMPTPSHPQDASPAAVEPSPELAPAPTPHPLPPMPIWTPNPGVPLLARILAYLFGTALLVTTVVTWITPHQIDPPKPEQWTNLPIGTEIVIPYPAGWQTEEHPGENGAREASFALPGSPAHLEVIVLPLDIREFRDEAVEKLQQKMVDWLTARYKQFEVQPGSFHCDAGEAKRFTFLLNDAPIAGALLFVPKGTHTLGIVAFSPPDGWPVMQDIFMHTVNGASSN